MSKGTGECISDMCGMARMQEAGGALGGGVAGAQRKMH